MEEGRELEEEHSAPSAENWAEDLLNLGEILLRLSKMRIELLHLKRV